MTVHRERAADQLAVPDPLAEHEQHLGGRAEPERERGADAPGPGRARLGRVADDRAGGDRLGDGHRAVGTSGGGGAAGDGLRPRAHDGRAQQ